MGKQITVGVFAHVDAGKTTLCEAMLYSAGAIRRLGRVDKQDSWFDTHTLERSRGITIFSKQAPFTVDGVRFTLLDTPGHVDFAAEAERVLPVCDCAIMVISGTDGVQAHTETLWRLLVRYRVPTFIFITKMDLLSLGRAELISQLKSRLVGGFVDCSEAFVDSGRPESLIENIAETNDELTERYLDGGEITEDDIAALVRCRSLVPCFFGSGLKNNGVEPLLRALAAWTSEPGYSDEFAAKVYKIDRDAQGQRLTHIKVTGGSLKVRTTLEYTDRQGDKLSEKVTSIRLISGARSENAEEAQAGSIVALSGLTQTYAGQVLGIGSDSSSPVLEPVLSCRVRLPQGCDARTVLPKLAQLEEEDPLLRFKWDEHLGEIHAQIMGEVQTEILQSEIERRFGVTVEFDEGSILYKETIVNTVEGVGHFEPLRHYAEVHLLIEPLERGSGVAIATDCPTDDLAANWQHLILYNLGEKEHIGVLGGYPLTDVKITLKSGRSHLKHTEGGDMREATLRAVRMGLMNADSVLLEPIYRFRLTVPTPLAGRAVNDIRSMSGIFDIDAMPDGSSVITGKAPISEMRGYASEVASYSAGRGSLVCESAGYDVCHNAAEVLAERGYDPERDVDNTPDSVFCRHGAGFIVKWREVPSYMHLESVLKSRANNKEARHRRVNIDEAELEALMKREFGDIKRPQYSAARVYSAGVVSAEPKLRRRHLLVDGYNVLFALPETSELAKTSIETARQRLMDELANYAGFTENDVVLVFDAYRSHEQEGKSFDYHGIEVLFTAEDVTADAWLERFAHKIGKNDSVHVVSSDGMIQVGVLAAGVLRMTSKELGEELTRVNNIINELIEKNGLPSGTRFEELLDDNEKSEWREMLRRAAEENNQNGINN